MNVNAAPWLKEIESFEEAESPVRATVKGLGPASFPQRNPRRKESCRSHHVKLPTLSPSSSISGAKENRLGLCN